MLVLNTLAVSSEPSVGCSAKYLSTPYSRVQDGRLGTMEEEGGKWIHLQRWVGVFIREGGDNLKLSSFVISFPFVAVVFLCS